MTGNFQLEVPNNAIGKTFIKMVRRFLNRKKYTLLVRGRGNNRRERIIEAGFRPTYTMDLPLVAAERLVIYINPKKVEKYDRRV